jgi:outer membrane protein
MRKLFIGGVLAALMSVPAMAQTTSLKHALEATYKNNPTLAQTREQIKNLDEGVVQALAGLKPTVAGSISASITDPIKPRFAFQNQDSYSNTATLSISQLLYDGGQTRGKVDSAKLALYAGREELIAAEQATMLGTITAFMGLREAQAKLDLANNNISVLREQLRASRDRFEVGEVTRTDVSQTEARLALAISNKEATRALVLGAIADYVAVVGEKPHNLKMPPDHPKIPSSLATAESVAVQNHPRVRAAALNLRATEVDLSVARLNRVPTITGTVAASSSASQRQLNFTKGKSRNVSVGIDASIPIYSGGKLDSSRRAASNSQIATQYALQVAKDTTLLNLRRNYANWQAAVAAIQASQAQIRAARIAFEGVNEEAKLGARTTLDVLDAEQELLSARSNLVSALRDEQVQAYNVLAEMGLLTAEALRLNVVRHNPVLNYNKVVKDDSPLGLKRINLLEKLQKKRNKN